MTEAQLFYLTTAKNPILEIHDAQGSHDVPFTVAYAGRSAEEQCWQASPRLPANSARDEWQFRIRLNDDQFDQPPGYKYYRTLLHTLWLQDGQIFSYKPAPEVSTSQVLKINNFVGSLPERALYIYLPRGYKEHRAHHYPILLMHDGQNCFEAFVDDSFAGSWQADLVADRVIGQGLMRECIIVGVSNGQKERLMEYMPPYVRRRLLPDKSRQRKATNPADSVVNGRADQTVAYYRYEIVPYLRKHYRTLKGREHLATCGSSMGGLFSSYIAWERTDFAQHHAAMSPSYWVTRTPHGSMETVERFRNGDWRDVRLWLDSGTLDAPGRGDDGMYDTIEARDALLARGYIEGENFKYYLDEGATHSEGAWAGRLHLVFQFLFPSV